MLQLKNIVKTYVTGDLRQDALKGVSIAFRENEFVSILGHSGSGKTTLLNIIGGLDRYDSGDLRINGVSTKKYKDADWDYYRNNSIGFVFQSYNLIPHQTVLANVEMALTLAGVSKKERRARALEVLSRVGLSDHIHKKPNQMSGGQMQRVAIARALINNPDILLADEPTGALDSETSIQIMELLREIAKDKLVIMVTHNPELAASYSTRIVNLRDGQIVSDSMPYVEQEEEKQPVKRKKISMSFATALSLSFNNLRTKKGRTLLTSFAGSIGIIGIALILALSTGMNEYIADIQKDTMSAYPITISSESIDLSSAMGMRGEIVGTAQGRGAEHTERTGVYADYKDMEANEMISSNIVENNLTEFKKYLDDPDSEIHNYLGENGVVYTYNVNFSAYTYDAQGRLLNTDTELEQSSPVTMQNGQSSILNNIKSTVLGNESQAASNFIELTAGANGSTVSPIITDNYDLLCGSWPARYDEVLLVLDQDNSISAAELYQLGFLTKEEYDEIADQIAEDRTADEFRLDYDEVLQHTFYLVTASDHYLEKEDGTFSYLDSGVLSSEDLLQSAVELHISGIIRPKEDADNAALTAAVAYTSALTDYIIAHTDESAIVKAQEANPELNVLTGMKFESPDDASKAEDAKQYLMNLDLSDKASFYKLMMYYSGGTSGAANPTIDSGAASDAANPTIGSGAASDTANPAVESGAASDAAAMTQTPGVGAERAMTSDASDEASMAAALDLWLENQPDEEILLKVYDEYISGSSYEDNLAAFGKVSYDAPASISIYTDSFENKDAIAACITDYNDTVSEENAITYTDYVAMLTSSITTIIDGISYVLVAFVAISLVVSCIMIGIITHISVMERTKEIGILRALGASKRNISQVFNAETFIIGCCAGLIGIGVSLLALFPINDVIQKVSKLPDLSAQLPIRDSALLILLSIVITMIGGLLPAKKAAKKDPVAALRTE